MRVRQAEPREAESLAPELARLHREALESDMALGELQSVPQAELEERYRERVACLDPAERIMFVAEIGDAIVGMGQLAFSRATNAQHRAEIQRLAVSAAARGTGVGRALMRGLEDAAREHGITLIVLNTHARTDACTFYEALGYTLLGEIPAYTLRPDGTPWPGAIFFKEL